MAKSIFFQLDFTANLLFVPAAQPAFAPHYHRRQNFAIPTLAPDWKQMLTQTLLRKSFMPNLAGCDGITVCAWLVSCCVLRCSLPRFLR